MNFENTSFAQAAINKNTWKNIKLHNCDFRSTLIYVDDYAVLKKYNVNLQWAVEKKGELHELNVWNISYNKCNNVGACYIVNAKY